MLPCSHYIRDIRKLKKNKKKVLSTPLPPTSLIYSMLLLVTFLGLLLCYSASNDFTYNKAKNHVYLFLVHPGCDLQVQRKCFTAPLSPPSTTKDERCSTLKVSEKWLNRLWQKIQ